ncbi:hypothetical protein DACRYDRAFT_21432 [Dacryopinax primogenitus]|uniref:NADH dehydrogenase [ubiquinone] iron-sulfur protein 4, mitochondrial n=1 Tax=Dacryopinax primogenitus (strain DJM 731) TaxID=1858805 RepID=M5GAX6_DACPD|nr:uncharacterized protein DACRYDRAFT_21432 [Dacryopinax primogenitus]EJU03137.1 hypothetical protein DACRYDRAFT_21432 [Dacryopinax primogenitus]
MLPTVARPLIRRTIPSLAAAAGAVRHESNSVVQKTEAIKEHSEHVKDAIFKNADREVTTAEVISGAPPELQYRSVRIFKPTRNTMQSAASGSSKWRIDWDTLPAGGRWENRLMGWASSADYMQGTRLSFRTKEEAIHFVEKQGWDYFVQEEHVKRIPPKAYAENFVHIPGKLRIARTK